MADVIVVLCKRQVPAGKYSVDFSAGIQGFAFI